MGSVSPNPLSLARRPPEREYEQRRNPSCHGEEGAHTGSSSPHVWQLVLRINAIYEARRGKKRVKRLSQSTESNSGKGRTPPPSLLPQESENRIFLEVASCCLGLTQQGGEQAGGFGNVPHHPVSLCIHQVSLGLHALTSPWEQPSLLHIH